MHLDEAFFVVLVLLVPTAAIFATVALATVTAQLVKRRPVVKAVFNSGQMLVSVWCATTVFDLMGRALHITQVDVVAAVVAAAVMFMVNSVAVALVMAATGTPFRNMLFDGLDMRFMLDCGGLIVAVPTALAVASASWALPFAVLPLIVLRQMLAGHFEARCATTSDSRDRSRRPWTSTHTMGTEETRSAILDSARELLALRSDATLGEAHPRQRAFQPPWPWPTCLNSPWPCRAAAAPSPSTVPTRSFSTPWPPWGPPHSHQRRASISRGGSSATGCRPSPPASARGCAP